MYFRKFYLKWLANHMSNDNIYDDAIKRQVIELCEVLIRQNHSGASWDSTIKTFFKLIEDYNKNG